jgi:hypothetical protein
MRSKLLMLVAVLAVTGIASAELLQDPGFETGWPPWSRGLNTEVWTKEFAEVGGGTFDGVGWYYFSNMVIIEPYEARSGDKYLRLGNFVPSWAGWASWGYAELGQVVFEGAAPDVEYTLSAYFMDDRGMWGATGTVDVHLKLNFFTKNGNRIGDVNGQVHEISSDWNLGWQQRSFTFKAPDGTAEIRALVGNDSAYGFVRIDDVTLCSGSTPSAPDPSIGVTVGYTCQTDLSWETCDGGNFAVYLAEGTPNPDPNLPPYVFGPGDLIDPNTSATTVPVTLLNNTDYVWRVDSIDPNDGNFTVLTTGDVWWFSTGDAPPEVYAGSDQYLLLDPILEEVEADLDGTLICDDGNSNVTYKWSEPYDEVSIASPTSLSSATATITATGSYMITLTASDGVGESTDTVMVNVYDDACAAAIADPTDYTPMFDGDISGPSGDLDCVVDIFDFAAMAIDWLDCASDKLGCSP